MQSAQIDFFLGKMVASKPQNRAILGKKRRFRHNFPINLWKLGFCG